ncbi:hypothetical protein Pyrde_1901 [Pyrodictium delaneyi]|uniref:ATP-cone domain-containing protein n=1 Tax=Pyrodictium delaneyi TaxID=1273541 RepID=A0A0P0N5Z2_9CREN|nr:hypothetical protein [Pyrodictium delaneyi]ALL01944.1 hypothetical protein Pyrde_1901 [Pyrodictium delaneyi]
MVLRLKQSGVVDGFDLEELEEIVASAAEKAVEKAIRRRGDTLAYAQRVLQVYQFFESNVGDKQVALELTRIVFVSEKMGEGDE